MGSQMRFFEKNSADYQNRNMTVSASQGDTFAIRALNRNNISSWVTTGSVDADNTAFEVDYHEPRNVSVILLVKHNFKSFKIQYYNGSSYVDFPTAIDVTTNTDTNSIFEFAQTSVEKIKITIRGTIVPDSDKQLYQFISTVPVGQFNLYPVISNVKHNQNKILSTMLSGRMNINKNLGGFSFDMAINVWKNQGDLTLVKALYDATEGVLVWISAGVTNQFSMSIEGYRPEDIYLMQPQNDFMPEWFKGVYTLGLNNLKISMVEVNL